MSLDQHVPKTTPSVPLVPYQAFIAPQTGDVVRMVFAFTPQAGLTDCNTRILMPAPTVALENVQRFEFHWNHCDGEFAVKDEPIEDDYGTIKRFPEVGAIKGVEILLDASVVAEKNYYQLIAVVPVGTDEDLEQRIFSRGMFYKT